MEHSEFWIRNFQNNMDGHQKITKENIAKFCSEFDPDTTPDFLFRNFEISDLDDIELDDCKNFFTKYGSFIKSLRYVQDNKNPMTLCGCRFDWHNEEFVEEFRLKFRMMLMHIKIVENLDFTNIPMCLLNKPFVLTPEEVAVNQLENVKSFDCYFDKYPENLLEPTEFMSGFIAMMPNVVSIAPHIWGNYTPFVHAIRNLKLTKLDCPDIFPADFFTLLKNQRQELNYVRLGSFSRTDAEQSELFEFLNSQKNTLEYLAMEIVCSRNCEFQFPTLKALKHLIVEHSTDSDFSPILSINKSSLVPQLRQLEACLDCIRSPFLFTEFETVQTLHLANEEYRRGQAKVLRTLGTMFPRLKSLELSTNKMADDCFPAIFSAFPTITILKLEIITNRCRKDINLVLSGLPEKAEGPLPSLDDPESFGQDTPLPSIRDFKSEFLPFLNQ